MYPKCSRALFFTDYLVVSKGVKMRIKQTSDPAVVSLIITSIRPVLRAQGYHPQARDSFNLVWELHSTHSSMQHSGCSSHYMWTSETEFVPTAISYPRSGLSAAVKRIRSWRLDTKVAGRNIFTTSQVPQLTAFCWTPLPSWNWYTLLPNK